MSLEVPWALRPPRAAYVHIPFCLSKCYYCEFSSFPGMEPLFGPYTDALVEEIGRTPPPACVSDDGCTLDSVYLGGGTPTLLPEVELARVLSALRGRFGLLPGCEVTIEANPGTVDESSLAQLLALGLNRLSLGVQSFDDDLLSRIGRAHSARQAIDAYSAARGAGFRNTSIDLIFALPGQTVRHWSKTLDVAAGLDSEHVSLYELTVEEGTRFAQMCAEGLLELPGEDEQLEMYELAIQRLTGAGFKHYEVSNFARPGFCCRHNQVYWRNEPYYGFGAGATSYTCGDRSRRVPFPRDYIAAIESGSDLIEFSEHLEDRALLAETVIQGLRMLDGIDTRRFRETTGADLLHEYEQEIDRLAARGLVEVADGHLRVTHQGLLLLNDVAQEFLPPPA